MTTLGRRVGGASLRSRMGLIALGALLLLSAFTTALPIGSATAPLAPRDGGAGSVGSSLAHSTLASSPPLASSGPGAFFTNLPLPFANATSLCTAPSSYPVQQCAFENVSTDPTAVITSSGEIAVAYTAYTNYSACGGNGSLSEIGFTNSTNNGASWSTPILVGNDQCDPANASAYVNSWEPAITALANGTLVLAFVEWSQNPLSYLYGGYYNTFPAFSPNSLIDGTATAGAYNASRIVVSRSYDGGALWSEPSVVNASSYNASLGSPGENGSASWVDENPTVAASGDTVYLAWQNTTWLATENDSNTSEPAVGDSGVQFVNSTDGGIHWSTQQALPVVAGNDSLVAANPDLLTTPSGEVLVAYTTNFTTECDEASCVSFEQYIEPVIGGSTTNGSSWTWHKLPAAIWDGNAVLFQPWHIGLQPQIGYDSTNGTVVVAYVTATIQTFCGIFSCRLVDASQIAVAHGTIASGGFAPTLLPSFTRGDNSSRDGYESSFFNLDLAVSARGTVDLAVSFINDSLVGPGSYYGSTFNFVGGQQQLYASSTNDGATFSPPITVDSNWSAGVEFPNYEYMPVGLRGALLAVGNNVDMVWAQPTCPQWNNTAYSCNYFIGQPVVSSTSLVFSQIFTGAGTTITFTETGLVNGTVWSIDLMGNLRGGPAPTPLSVSGVPIGVNENFTVSNLSSPWSRTSGLVSSPSPLNVTGTTTISVAFSLQFLVSVTTIPALTIAPSYASGGGYCGAYWWDNPCTSLNYNYSGPIGSFWFDAGSKLNATVAELPGADFTSPYPTSFNQYLNLSFLDWFASGTGGVTTTNDTMAFIVTGPVNESANFALNGYCEWEQGPWTSVCAPSNATFRFAEVGLPAGSHWGVELYGTGPNQSAPDVAETSGTMINVTDQALGTSAYYLPLTVPGAGSTIYVASGSPLSPVLFPRSGLVTLTYAPMSGLSGSVPSSFQEVGLPNGTAWTYEQNSIGTGAPNALVSGSATLGSNTLSAGPIYLANGTGYYVQAIDLLPLTNGESWQNVTANSTTVNVNSSLVVIFEYGVMYRVSVSASVGGTVFPGSSWEPANSTVALVATPSTNYSFVGWTGTGYGGVDSSATHISVTLQGPVSELATFEPFPAVRYTVTVQATGLPAGAVVGVTFDGSSYSGSPPFVLPSVTAGDYSFSAATLMANATAGVEYVPTGTSSTFGSGPGGTWNITENGTLTVAYAVDYMLNVFAGPSGTASALGASWQLAGSTFLLTASPSTGYALVGWVGVGTGSVTGNSTSISVVMGGPISETVSFAAIPPVPLVTYTLAVSETGLPIGKAWPVTVNGNGIVASTSSIHLTEPAGTYSLGFSAIAAATSGSEYAPNTTSTSISLTNAGLNVSVTFTTEYWVDVEAGVGGSVSPAGGAWYAAGATVSLVATASSGYTFAGWVGSGSGSYSGASASESLVVPGSVTEVASFTPTAPTGTSTSSGSSTAGLPLDLGLLVALLVVGLLVVLLLGRPPRSPEGTAEVSADAPRPNAQESQEARDPDEEDSS
jgi:Divergent InlB B-repeat domain